MLLSLVSVALAGSPAFYDPDAVGLKSAKFGVASEAVGPKFEVGEKQVSKLGAAAESLEIGTALLGNSAPAELTAFTTETRRQLTGQYLRLQKHVSLIQGDFSNVFTAAVERVLPALSVGKDVRICAASGVAAMMHRTDCTGEDLNAAIAAAIDKDAQLDTDLAEILSVEWPTVALSAAPQGVVSVTGGDRWISLPKVAAALAGAQLTARRDNLEATLEQLSEDLEARDTGAMAAAAAAKKAYLEGLGADGAILRAAVEASLQKQKSAPASWGWCPNPKSLGGCAGEDVTSEVLELVAKDKKLARLSFGD